MRQTEAQDALKKIEGRIAQLTEQIARQRSYIADLKQRGLGAGDARLALVLLEQLLELEYANRDKLE
ncbi:MAG: hypothetical protein WBX25_35410 [Rhodomicrobium sp.]